MRKELNVLRIPINMEPDSYYIGARRAGGRTEQNKCFLFNPELSRLSYSARMAYYAKSFHGIFFNAQERESGEDHRLSSSFSHTLDRFWIQ